MGAAPDARPSLFFTATAGAPSPATCAGCPCGCAKISRNRAMAKPTTVKIKLVSTADTGFFYFTKKNPRQMNEKMAVRKYAPPVRNQVEESAERREGKG